MKINSLIKSIDKACFYYIHRYLYNKISNKVEGYVNYNNAIDKGEIDRKDVISMLRKLGYTLSDDVSNYDLEMQMLNWIVNNLNILDTYYKYKRDKDRGIKHNDLQYKASKMLFANEKTEIDTDDIRKIYKDATKYYSKIYYKDLSREDILWVLKKLDLCRKEVK